MRLRSLSGKLTQLRHASPACWAPFVLGYIFRRRKESIPCVVPGCPGLLYLPARDFYDSYAFFCENPQGRRELAYFMGQIKQGDVLYDIGAFRGVFSAACKLKLPQGVSVYAFEPIKKNTEAIERIRQLNHFAGFTIVPCAVGDGTMLSANEQDDMLCADAASRSPGAKEVRTISLDRYIADGNPAPTIMKIDVEGYELQILAGARECLKTHRPRLWLEVHPEFLKGQKQSPDDVLRILRQAGYEISYFDDYHVPSSKTSYHIWCVADGRA